MKIGILGAGQLGRMLALAGYPLGLEFRFFDANEVSPARSLGEFVCAPFNDQEALKRFANGVDLVTTEFENIDIGAIEAIEKICRFYPGAHAVATSQDRLLEKDFFNKLGIATAPFRKIDTESDLISAATDLGFPLILKTRRLGYDGKGQYIVRKPEDITKAFKELGQKDLIAEGFVNFSRELSIIAVRSAKGEFGFYPLNINKHANGILAKTVVSSSMISLDIQRAAETLARKTLESLDYVGVLVIELFDTNKGLIVNEMAPRVHNSGHWSIEGAVTSQFENHLRAVFGMPLGSTKTFGECGMINILHRRPDMNGLLAIPGAKVHWYGKEPRLGRKLGHVTIVEPDLGTLEAKLNQVGKCVLL